MKFRLDRELELSKNPYLTLKQRDFIYQRSPADAPVNASWFFVERNEDVRAVVIVPYISSTDEIVLIKQFRVPFWKYVIEFPAGLVESWENIPSAAKRELKEETGFDGQVIFQSPLLAVSAGLTSEMFSFCVVQIDTHQGGLQDLESTENIDIFKVPRKEFSSFCSDMMEKEGCVVDCKVYLSGGLLQGVVEESLCKK